MPADSLSSHLQIALEKARADLEKVDPSIFLTEDRDVLLEQVIGKFFPEPVEIDWERVSATEPKEVETAYPDPFYDNRFIHGRGNSLTFRIPYSGSLLLLTKRGSTYRPVNYYLESKNGEIILDYTARELKSEELERFFQSKKDELNWRADVANGDLKDFLVIARDNLLATYESRKTNLENNNPVLKQLKIPVYRTDVPTPPIPAKRTRVSLEDRREQRKLVPEPVLEGAIYEDIIKTIRHWSNSLERSGRAVRDLGEEDLRDLLLANLNGYFQGEAGGELFNANGKTDILIRHNDKNAFIAECKIWKGEAQVEPTVNQLFNYLTWRDSKAALIFFIKTKNPTQPIKKLHEAISNHPRYIKDHHNADADSVRKVDMSLDSEQRVVTVAVIPVVLSTES